MSCAPERILDPLCRPLILSRWPNPLLWMHPCRRWEWASIQSLRPEDAPQEGHLTGGRMMWDWRNDVGMAE